MKAQDTNYTSPPSAVQNIVASKISLGDSYILYETAENEYTALIKKAFSDDAKEIKIYRVNNYNTWQVEEIKANKLDYTVNNEYYVFSNIGYGQTLNLPIHDIITSYSTVIICCLGVLLFMFKGVFLKCRKR